MLCLYEVKKIYNIKSFLRYVITRYYQDQRELAYRIYVTDSLQIIGKGVGGYLTKRYQEIIDTNVVEDVNPNDVIENLKKKGLVING